MKNKTIGKAILGIRVESKSKGAILEQIKKYTKRPSGFFHIASVNPENIVISQTNSSFRKAVNTAQIRIIDGVGIVIAGWVLGVPVGPRLTGVDLMDELTSMAGSGRLRVALIGGKGKLAEYLANCYSQLHPEAKFIGIEGIKNIKNPTTEEEKRVISIVADYKPHFVFFAFGSPYQELWIEKNRSYFTGMVSMGVGGGFDFLSGKTSRAPKLLRRLGLEWLYRLLSQPWRIIRQGTRLPLFIWLVIKERIKQA